MSLSNSIPSPTPMPRLDRGPRCSGGVASLTRYKLENGGVSPISEPRRKGETMITRPGMIAEDNQARHRGHLPSSIIPILPIQSFPFGILFYQVY
jgi:hypothetical protein